MAQILRPGRCFGASIRLRENDDESNARDDLAHAILSVGDPRTFLGHEPGFSIRPATDAGEVAESRAGLSVEPVCDGLDEGNDRDYCDQADWIGR